MANPIITGFIMGEHLRDDALDECEILRFLPARDLRSIARRIERIADALDVDPRYDCPAELSERDVRTISDAVLLTVARHEYAARRRRSKFLDKEIVGEPAWDMLLDLFIRHVRGERTSTSSLCLAGDAPLSTGLRWIQVLEKRKLVVRTADVVDHRVVFVELSDTGLTAIRNCLAAWL